MGADYRIHRRNDGEHEVRNSAGDVMTACRTNAEAWRWIDRHSEDGQMEEDRHLRIRSSSRFA